MKWEFRLNVLNALGSIGFVALLSPPSLLGTEIPRAVGIFENNFNDTGTYLGDYDNLSTLLIYREFNDNPEDDGALQKSLQVAKSSLASLQIGFEPNFLPNEALAASILGQGQLDTNTVYRYTLAGEALNTVKQKYNEANSQANLPVGIELNGSELILHANYLNRTYGDLLRWSKYLQTQKLAVILRPMSEINLGDSIWELHAEGARNSPASFVKAWSALRGLFPQSTQSPIALSLEVSSWASIEIDPETLAVLNSLKSEELDAIGIHPYAAPLESESARGAIGSFQSMVEVWTRQFTKIPALANKPILIGEMGVGARAGTLPVNWDATRAAWITDAFAYACQAKIRQVTYFDEDDGNLYSLGSQSPQAREALETGASLFSSCP